MNDTVIRLRNLTFQKIFNINLQYTFNPLMATSPQVNPTEILNDISSTIKILINEVVSNNGNKVNYGSIKKNNNYKYFTEKIIPQLHNIDLNTLKNDKQKKAFWINLYNALVLHSVLYFEIENSVMENGFLGMVRFFSEPAYTIGKYRFSLDDIEHGILRNNRGNPYYPCNHFSSDDPRLKYKVSQEDPRIHFALNCASTSCAPINFYLPSKIDQQLNTATRNFIDQETLFRNNRLELSSIFNWYRKDFGGKKGLINFLIRHLSDDDRRKYLEENNSRSKLHFTPYDWNLNHWVK